MNQVSIIGKNLGIVDEELSYDSIEELAAIISSESWSPGLFSERKRLIANLTRIDLLVLDVDSGATLEEAREAFKTYKHIVATSRSHQKEKNGVTCDRFRVVLFLDGTITNDRDFKSTWNTASKRWPYIDAACKDSSRFFYASPEVVSINSSGRDYPVSIAAPIVSAPTPVVVQPGSKGDLWKSTLRFLVEGAAPGTRHNALVQAVGNMREQNYSKSEVIEKLEGMILAGGEWTQPHLSAIDLKTVDRMFEREMKYQFKPQEIEKNENRIIVTAAELLSETISYLGDKDKVKGEPTGIAGLDKLLGGGFRTGELTVLMAQAKTGKNTLYHDLIHRHLNRGISFGYASRELNPATEVVPNLLSIAMQSNAWKAEMNESFQTRAAAILSKWQLFFAPGYGYFSSEEIEKWFRTLKDLGVNHFLFDHFHYALEGEDYEATAKLIKKLKSLTKELDIHLSLIVQPRSLRENEALSLATLRGGAAIGQALDNLLILERVKGEENISKLTLEVARHKLARLGAVYLKYDPTTTAFEEVDKLLVQEQPRIPQGIQRKEWNKFAQS